MSWDEDVLNGLGLEILTKMMELELSTYHISILKTNLKESVRKAGEQKLHFVHIPSSPLMKTLPTFVYHISNYWNGHSKAGTCILLKICGLFWTKTLKLVMEKVPKIEERIEPANLKKITERGTQVQDS